VIRRDLGDKAVKLVYAGEGWSAARSVKEVPVPRRRPRRFVLTTTRRSTLARWAILVEEHYSEETRRGRADGPRVGQGRPHWGAVHRAGPARDRALAKARRGTKLETFRLKGKGRALVDRQERRLPASAPARPASSAPPTTCTAFKPGEVLIAEMTDPDWELVLRKAAAVVTDRGGRTCHAAIVSREMGLPCVVGTGSGTEAIKRRADRDGLVRRGRRRQACTTARCPSIDESLDPATLPVSPRAADAQPRRSRATRSGSAAFRRRGAARWPGVGLMRIEFLVSNWIGVHPMALVHPERVADPDVRAEIRRRTADAGHGADLTEFFVSRLAEGVAQIGAAFFPRPVIVRFSDFKTNEYAGLLGGETFEPKEENPMIGWRGASRYYDDRYREGFALECAAIRRVREDMGLINVIVMIPFCRTLNEGRAVLAEMARHGLERGRDGMQIYVMCEIPNNVVLATQFSELFDGFSIGSNDLTQLTLGVDRDSEQLAHVFDERDPGVKAMIEMVVQKAHASGRKVGICGEAPSNYPDFAAWLAGIGIDSMSLNPDALPGVARTLRTRPEA
jgi:pyruvate,water dikinase